MLISLNFDPGITLHAVVASETQWMSNENTYRARPAALCVHAGLYSRLTLITILSLDLYNPTMELTFTSLHKCASKLD